MKKRITPLSIVQSYKILKGNSKLSVDLELSFGIPYTLLTFYTSLYMKSQGVTDKQIGYIITIQFLCAALFSIFAGAITDALGRKKALLIFDLIAWPCTTLLWFFSNSFSMFAAAAVLSSTNQIVMVAWTCFLVEDAGSEERVAAFNLTNLLSLCTGIIMPLGGLLVGYLGIVNGQRAILMFATVIFTARILVRDHFTVETRVGRQILEERKRRGPQLRSNIYFRTFKAIMGNRTVLTAMVVNILFNIGVVAFSFTSRCLYYVPYLTEVLGLDKSYISFLGTVSSIVMLVVFVLVVPWISGTDNRINLIRAALLMIASFVIFLLAPKGSYAVVTLSTIVYFAGYGIVRTFMDAMFADAAEGRERAGIYSVTYVISSLLTAAAGPLIGLLYSTRPPLTSIIAGTILVIIVLLLIASLKNSRLWIHKGTPAENEM